MAQLNTMLTSAEKSKRHIEFCCKCVRRAMELPDVNLEELSTLLDEKLVVPEELKEAIYRLLE
jgi:ribosomal protein L16 Arg81 hydroxylase